MRRGHQCHDSDPERQSPLTPATASIVLTIDWKNRRRIITIMKRRDFIRDLGLGATSVLLCAPSLLRGKQAADALKSFKSIPIIDGHFHMLADIEQQHLFTRIPAIWRACGLRAANVLSVSAGGPLNQNMAAALAKALYPDRCYAFAGLHYSLPAVAPKQIDLGGQAKTLFEIGFDGFKMIEGKPSVREQLGVALDDPVYDEYYSFLESEALPLVFHVADPWSGGEPPEAIARVYSEAENVLQRFPGLHIIFAHFYFMGHHLDRAAELLETYPSICFDLTPGPGMYTHFSVNPEKSREFFIRYQDRIVFGTDNHGEARSFGPGAPLEYWPVFKMIAMRTFLETDRTFTAWHNELHGIALERDVLEKIYHGNFVRLAGASPKKLDIGLTLQHGNRILALAREYGIVHEVLPELRRFMDKISTL